MVARVKSFVQLSRRQRNGETVKNVTEITDEDEEKAVVLILLEAQMELTERDTKGLSPARGEDGLIRMQSRLARAPNMAYETKYPVILPRWHAVTRLLLQYHHQRMGHQNHNQTLLEMRRRGCVTLGIKEQLSRVVRECPNCILMRAQPE